MLPTTNSPHPIDIVLGIATTSQRLQLESEAKQQEDVKVREDSVILNFAIESEAKAQGDEKEEAAVVIEVHPLETHAVTQEEQSFIQRHGLTINGGIITGVTAFESIANRTLLNNTSIGTKTSSSGASLLVDLVASNVITHMLKANVKFATSGKHQIYVLVRQVLMSVTLDVTSGAIFGGGYVGPATVIGCAAAAAQLAKILFCKVLGQPSGYLLIVPPVAEENREADQKRREYIGAAAEGGLCLAAAFAQQMMESQSAGALIVSAQTSNIINKSAKVALATKSGKKSRIKTAFVYSVIIPTAASVLAGLANFQMAGDQSGYDRLASLAYHYFGPVTAVALSSFATNTLIRALQKPKNATQEGHIVKKTSKKKAIVSGAAFEGVTALSAGAFAANRVVGDSGIVSLGIKNLQAGWSFHLGRETLKGTSNNLQRLIALTCLVAGAILVQIAVQYLDPTGDFTPAIIVIGVTATFLAKMLRNELAPKPKRT